jgi:putative PIN family toxin of toxin-antitoxin system
VSAIARVVFDTNILLSAIGWKGTPYECLELARQGKVESFTRSEILDEPIEKLRFKLKFPDSYIAETLTDLISYTSLVQIQKTLRVIEKDPDDDIILECAVVSRANYIVTGDKKHLLPLQNYQNIQIITAIKFKNIFIQ